MLIIHSDGGARGNPGPAGAGVYITDAAGQRRFAGGFFLGKTTNNVAEYTGLIEGLRAAQRLAEEELEIRCDSELLVRQLNGDYKVKSPLLKPLYDQAVRLMDTFKTVRVQHVYREMNAKADALANQAMDAGRNIGDAVHSKTALKTSKCPGLFDNESQTSIMSEAGPVSPRASQDKKPKKKKIFVLGDSISIGYGSFLEKRISFFADYTRKESMPQALENLDYPHDANGGDSSMALAYLRERFAQADFQPDYLLINCGLHDIKTDIQTGAKQVPLERYRGNLEQIKRLALRQGVRLVWLRTTPVDDDVHNSRSCSFHRFAADVEAYNEAADEIMQGPGVCAIDLFGFTKSLGGAELFCDHVHYPPAIQEAQAAFIAGYLAAILR